MNYLMIADDICVLGYQFFTPFTVTNGIRQRGVLTPYLFAPYLDELLYQLDSAKLGYAVGNVVVNHLMLADNMCVQPQYLWTPTSSEYLWLLCS